MRPDERHEIGVAMDALTQENQTLRTMLRRHGVTLQANNKEHCRECGKPWESGNHSSCALAEALK